MSKRNIQDNNMISGSWGSTWFRVVYQQSKNKSDEWIDDYEKPLQFLVGQGKTIIKLSMREVLSVYDTIRENKSKFGTLLADERKKQHDEKQFE